MFRLINNLKNRKGFTLIELIVVLAVLAIIMAIAVPRFMGIQEKAKEDADLRTVEMIEKSAELYFARENKTGSVNISVLVSNGYLNGDYKFNDTTTHDYTKATLNASNGAVTLGK